MQMLSAKSRASNPRRPRRVMTIRSLMPRRAARSSGAPGRLLQRPRPARAARPNVLAVRPRPQRHNHGPRGLRPPQQRQPKRRHHQRHAAWGTPAHRDESMGSARLSRPEERQLASHRHRSLAARRATVAAASPRNRRRHPPRTRPESRVRANPDIRHRRSFRRRHRHLQFRRGTVRLSRVDRLHGGAGLLYPARTLEWS
jgi:hypothetical protein